MEGSVARVLITGASRGLGRALAQELMKAGHQVVASARNLDDLGDLKVTSSCALDVTNERSIVEAARRIGDIDILINNAAYSISGPLEAIPAEELTRLIDVNLIGPHRLVRAFLPAMRKRGSGLIVNISSASARGAPPLQGAYAVSKTALTFYSQTLRQEVMPFGIQVLNLEPPGMNTKLVETQQGFSHTGYENYQTLGAELNRRRPEVDVGEVAKRIVNEMDQQPRMAIPKTHWLP